MPISVRCSNILRYDPQQGKYLRCHHEFTVGDDLAGRNVRCPQCGATITAPEASPPSSAPPSSAPPSSAPVPSSPAPLTPPQAATGKIKARTPPPAIADDDEEFRLSDPVEKPKPAFPGLDVDIGVKAPAAPPTPTPPGAAKSNDAAEMKAPCPGCGRPLAEQAVICTGCGYHKGLRRRVDEFDEPDQVAPAPGFEHWLRRQLVEGDDPGAIRSVLIMAALFLVACGACLFLVIGHAVWIFVAAAVIVVVGAKLGWWKLDPWAWRLFFHRMVQWRRLMPPFDDRKVLDLRSMPINDDELATLKSLAEFEVLDLEGTVVTDHGLPALYAHRNLRFIILRDTQTTEKGVSRLQQALPQALIWR